MIDTLDIHILTVTVVEKTARVSCSYYVINNWDVIITVA